MLYKIAQKTAFPITRHLIAFNGLRRQACQPILSISKGAMHTSAKRLFASHADWQQGPPKHPLIEQLQRHPHIMQQLIDFTSLLQSKGVDVSGKQPSFMQVMKVMSDPEVKEKVKVLAQDMQAAGIQLDMQTIQELQADFKTMADSYSNNNGEDEASEEKKQNEKKGVMNRVKGLFKK